MEKSARDADQDNPGPVKIVENQVKDSEEDVQIVSCDVSLLENIQSREYIQNFQKIFIFLKQWITECALNGFPRTYDEIQKEFNRLCAQHSLPEDKIPNLLKFFKHKQLLCRKFSDSIWSALTPRFALKNHHDYLTEHFKETNTIGILSFENRIHYASLIKYPHSYSKNAPETDGTFVLHMFSADGEAFPQFIIGKKGTFSKDIPSKNKFLHVSSESGQFVSGMLVSYLKTCFVPYLQKKNVKFPVIIFVDDLIPHLNSGVVQQSKKLDIHLVAGYPHLLFNNPTANGLFCKILNMNYRHEVKTYEDTQEKNVDEFSFRDVFDKALVRTKNQINIKIVIKTQFKRFGWFPWNEPNMNVEFDKFTENPVYLMPLENNITMNSIYHKWGIIFDLKESKVSGPDTNLVTQVLELVDREVLTDQNKTKVIKVPMPRPTRGRPSKSGKPPLKLNYKIINGKRVLIVKKGKRSYNRIKSRKSKILEFMDIYRRTQPNKQQGFNKVHTNFKCTYYVDIFNCTLAGLFWLGQVTAKFLQKFPEMKYTVKYNPTKQEDQTIMLSHLTEWHSNCRDFLSYKQSLHILEDPSRIVCFDIQNFRVKDDGVTLSMDFEGIDGTQVIVSHTIRANGSCLKPTIAVFGDENFDCIAKLLKICEKIPYKEHEDRTFNFFLQRIHTNLKELNVKFPIIVFVNPYKFIVRDSTLRLCEELKIILIGSYPHPARNFNPLEMILFDLKQEVENYQNSDGELKATDLLIAEGMAKLFTKSKVLEVFKNSGLSPFVSNNIDPSYFVKCGEYYFENHNVIFKSITREGRYDMPMSLKVGSNLSNKELGCRVRKPRTVAGKAVKAPVSKTVWGTSGMTTRKSAINKNNSVTTSSAIKNSPPATTKNSTASETDLLQIAKIPPEKNTKNSTASETDPLQIAKISLEKITKNSTVSETDPLQIAKISPEKITTSSTENRNLQTTKNSASESSQITENFQRTQNSPLVGNIERTENINSTIIKKSPRKIIKSVTKKIVTSKTSSGKIIKTITMTSNPIEHHSSPVFKKLPGKIIKTVTTKTPTGKIIKTITMTARCPATQTSKNSLENENHPTTNSTAQIVKMPPPPAKLIENVKMKTVGYTNRIFKTLTSPNKTPVAIRSPTTTPTNNGPDKIIKIPTQTPSPKIFKINPAATVKIPTSLTKNNPTATVKTVAIATTAPARTIRIPQCTTIKIPSTLTKSSSASVTVNKSNVTPIMKIPVAMNTKPDKPTIQNPQIIRNENQKVFVQSQNPTQMPSFPAPVEAIVKYVNKSSESATQTASKSVYMPVSATISNLYLSNFPSAKVIKIVPRSVGAKKPSTTVTSSTEPKISSSTEITLSNSAPITSRRLSTVSNTLESIIDIGDYEIKQEPLDPLDVPDEPSFDIFDSSKRRLAEDGDLGSAKRTRNS